MGFVKEVEQLPNNLEKASKLLKRLCATQSPDTSVSSVYFWCITEMKTQVCISIGVIVHFIVGDN
jgi:hypothetical protein